MPQVEQASLLSLVHPGVAVEQASLLALVGPSMAQVEQASLLALVYYPPVKLTLQSSTLLPGARLSVYAGDTKAALSSPSLLGVARLSVGLRARGLRLRSFSLLSSARLKVSRVLQASLQSPIPLGTATLQAASYGSAWTAAGLPCPSLQGYRYSADRGLVRTQMYSGYTRQRRKYTSGYRKGSLKLVIERDDLHSLFTFLDQYGYAWTNVPIVTEDSSTSRPSLHLIRVVADPKVSAVIGDTLTVSLEIEIQ